MSAVWRRFEAAVIFFGSFALAASVIKFKPFVEAGLGNLGWLAYPLAILIFTAVASAPFSVTDALAVMNGVIFGPLWGSVVNAIGLVFAAMVGYKLARRTSHLLELHDHIEKLPPWVRRFKVGSPPFLLTLRIIPGLGGTMATQIAAAFRVPMWVHVWTMCAIAIPVCTLLAIFGDRVSESVSSYYQHSRMTERIRHMFHRRPRPSPSGVRIERVPESSTHRESRP